MKKLLSILLFLIPALAFAQLELPFPIKMVNPNPLDFQYFESDNTPWDNTAEVVAGIPLAIRYRGMTVNVSGEEYWFKDGTTNGDLVRKAYSSTQYNFIKRRDTTNLTGSHQRTELIANLPNDDPEQWSEIYLSAKQDFGGGDSTIARVEATRRIDAIGVDLVDVSLRNQTYSSGLLTSEAYTGPGIIGYNVLSGGSITFSGRLSVTGSGFQLEGNGSPFNQGIVEGSDFSPNYVSGSLTRKSYVDAKIAQTITNGVTISAPSQDAVFDALALKQASDQALTDLSALNVIGNALKAVTFDASGAVVATSRFENPCTLPNCILLFDGATFIAIDVAGASTGDVLTYSGTDVDWAPPSGGGGSGTVTSITLTQPVAGLTITGSGTPITTTGTPTFALANDLAAYEGLSSNGFVSRTGTDAAAVRTHTGTSGRLTITNGDGVSGNPTYDISATFEGLLSKIANRIDQNNAATTSAQFAGVISDETGTGALVFGTSPTFTTQITTPSVVSASALALSGTSVTATVGGVTNNLTNWQDVTESSTSVTITEAHRGREVFLTNTSPIAVTLSNALTAGFNVTLTKAASAGVITVSAASGTLNTVGGVVTLDNDFSSATFRTYASNVWYGSGGLGSGGGGGGAVDDVTGTSPISVSPTTGSVVVSIADAAADGTTKGAVAGTAADFNSASGVFSIDYANGQAATSGQDGLLQSADWTTFNNKQATGLSRLLTGTNTMTGNITDAFGTNTWTITSTIPNGQTHNNAFIATANNQTAFRWNGLLTHSATTGRDLRALELGNQFLTGASTQTSIALKLLSTFTSNHTAHTMIGIDLDFLRAGSQDATAVLIPLLVRGSTGSVRVEGKQYIGGIGTIPTGLLHLAAGTTSASSGPIKLTEGVNPTSAEDGLINYVSNNLTFTETTTVHVIPKTLVGSATLNFDLTALNYQDLTITVTGAADGDAVSVGAPNGAVVADVTYFGWVSATNTVTVRCSRVGGGGAADPASGTFRASVIKP